MNAIASSADWMMTSRHKFRRKRRHARQLALHSARAAFPPCFIAIFCLRRDNKTGQ